MPFIGLETPTGQVNLSYSISTPQSHSATTIASGLPCILFFHPEYLAQEIFEAQFSDIQLRECFNLIAVDMRCYGYSTGPVEKGVFTPATAADDVYRFMKALDLPPLHIFALSIGCYTALELAHAHPDLVLSLTLCSHLPPTEPESVTSGRREVSEYWHECLKDGNNTPPYCETVRDMLSELGRGIQQLMFSGQVNRLTDPVTTYSLTQNVTNWAGSPENFAIGRTLCLAWLSERKHPSVRSLAQITCPITIIHCEDDIAYPSIVHAQEFKSLLQRAGHTDITLHQIPGPRCANVLNPEMVNTILSDFVLSVSIGLESSHMASDHMFPPVDDSAAPFTLPTPFTERLKLYGYEPSADDYHLGPCILEGE